MAAEVAPPLGIRVDIAEGLAAIRAFTRAAEKTADVHERAAERVRAAYSRAEKDIAAAAAVTVSTSNQESTALEKKARHHHHVVDEATKAANAARALAVAHAQALALDTSMTAKAEAAERAMTLAHMQALEIDRRLTASLAQKASATRQVTDATRSYTLAHIQALEIDRRRSAPPPRVTDSSRAITLAHLQALEMDRKFTAAAAAGQQQLATGAEKSALRISNAYSRVGTDLRSLLATLGVAFGIKQILDYADSWKLVSARLRLVTSSSEDLAATQAKLFAVAQSTRTSYEATATLYTRLARNAAQLGASQADLIKFTEAVQKSLQLSGATTQEATAGVIQLSQALASGVLRGDEFRSVMENMPGLAQAIAKGLGVTTGELRRMANEGELTADKVFKAVNRMKGEIDRDFSGVPLTIGQAFEVAKNNLQSFIGKADEAHGSTGRLARQIVSLSENLDGLAGALSKVLYSIQWVGNVFERLSIDRKFDPLEQNERIRQGWGEMIKSLTDNPVGRAVAPGLLDYAKRMSEAAEISGNTIRAKHQLAIQKLKKDLEPPTTTGANVGFGGSRGGARGGGTVLTGAQIEELQRRAEAERKLAIALAEPIERLKAEAAAQERLTRAMREGEAAVAGLTITLAGEKAIRDLLDQRAEKNAFTTWEEIRAVRTYAESIERAKIEQERFNAANREYSPNATGGRQGLFAGDVYDPTKDTRKFIENFMKTSKEMQGFMKQTTDASLAIWENFQRGLQEGFTQTFQNVLTGGVNSFRSLAASIRDIFARLVAELASMKLAEKLAGGVFGLDAKQLGWIGGTALAGGAIGATAGAGAGLFGGAAAGAQLAALGGPLSAAGGAVVGALAGLVGGIFHQGDELKKARGQFLDTLDAYVKAAGGQLGSIGGSLISNQLEAQRLRKQAYEVYPAGYVSPERDRVLGQIDLAEKLNQQKAIGDFNRDLDSLLNTLTGNEYANQLAEINARFWDQVRSIDAVYAVTKDAVRADEQLAKAREIQRLATEKLQAAEAHRITQIQADLAARALRARGLDEEAAAAAFAAQQANELFDAQQKGYSDALLAQLRYVQGLELAKFTLENTISAIEKNRDAQIDAITKAQGSLDGLKAAAEQLSDYSRTLRTTNPSVAPEALQRSQRAELQALYQKALGGDQSAASRFVTLGQDYERTLEAVFGRGTKYAAGRNELQAMTDALASLFGNRASDVEKQITAIMEAAQRQIDAAKQLAADRTKIETLLYELTERGLITDPVVTPVKIGEQFTLSLSPVIDIGTQQVSRLETLATGQQTQTAVLAAQLEAMRDVLDDMRDELTSLRTVSQDGVDVQRRKPVTLTVTRGR